MIEKECSMCGELTTEYSETHLATLYESGEITKDPIVICTKCFMQLFSWTGINPNGKI